MLTQLPQAECDAELLLLRHGLRELRRQALSRPSNGLADASIVVLAQGYGVLEVLTLDQRHFP